MNLATNGHVVLAVDLYQRKVTANPSEARRLKRDLPEDRVIRDMKAAFDYLVGRLDVHSKHIGSLGWSMGGGLALQLAIHEPRLAACVVNYGPLPTHGPVPLSSSAKRSSQCPLSHRKDTFFVAVYRRPTQGAATAKR